jgi:hypothetical protein
LISRIVASKRARSSQRNRPAGRPRRGAAEPLNATRRPLQPPRLLAILGVATRSRSANEWDR